MSDLGKIRAGSQRVFRDKVFGVKGQCTVLDPTHSADGLVRFVFHPEDISALMEEVAEENVHLLAESVAQGKTGQTIFGLAVVGGES